MKFNGTRLAALGLGTALWLGLFLAPAITRAQDSGTSYNYQYQSAPALDKLVGPVALYPDPLLAQVLLASSFPDQIASASYWLTLNPDQSGIDQQQWNPSVIAVAHYPTALNLLNQRPDWTLRLGQAYANQGPDVMQAVQRQRGLAQLQGNLNSTTQQTVSTQGNTIIIMPAVNDVIYVPTYDPVVVYTQPAPASTTPLVAFGAGMAVGSWMNSSVNWNSSTVVYQSYTTGWGGAAYYGNTAAYHSSGYTAAGGTYNANTTISGGYGNAYGTRSASGNTAYGGSWSSNAAGGVSANGSAWGARSSSGDTAAGGSWSSSANASRDGWGNASASRSASGDTAAGGSWDYNANAQRSSDGSASASRSLTGTTANGYSYGGGSEAQRNSDGSGSFSRGYAGQSSSGAFGGAEQGSWGAAGSSSRGFSSQSASFGGGGYGGGGFGGGGFGGGGFGGGGRFRR